MLAIVELGGYPDFSALYRSAGYEVSVESSMRRALNLIKRDPPHLIVAEFNYQSGFRDRVSNLESLMATVQRRPGSRVIVFYEAERADPFARVQARFPIFAALPFPIDPGRLKEAVSKALTAD